MSDSVRRKRGFSWSTFNDWIVPRRAPSWEACDAWDASFRRLSEATAIRIEEELVRWDGILGDLGGDPARQNWEKFRPLRLSREEDWSDWLAHLFERSRTGDFARRLLGGPVGDGLVKDAGREVRAGGFRVDIVLQLAAGGWLHIEVKTGDTDLAKTPGTADALREKLGGHRCLGDYLLLLPEQMSDWDECRSQLGARADAIQTITWVQVAQALRRSLPQPVGRDRCEDLAWRVWAFSFLGAVEQRLLGFSSVPKDAPRERSHRPRASDRIRLEVLESDKEA